MLLPLDIIFNISKYDNWVSSGPIARCSKHTLRMFTTPFILNEIIESIKRRGCCLFKWLVIALPSSYIIPDDLTFYNVSNIIQSVKETINPRVFTGIIPDIPISDRFITGGHVCKALYKCKWESDIDIYVKDRYIKVRIFTRYNNKKIDIIPTQLPHIESVIEDFDISITQQGLLDDCYYLTPLSLFTWYHGEIIAMPHESNIQYNFSQNHGSIKIVTKDIWYYINIHKNNHIGPDIPFHQCTKCGFLLKPICTWKERIKKYSSRFPYFIITYIPPPIEKNNM